MPELNKYDQARYDFMNRALALCYLKPTPTIDIQVLREENALYAMRSSMEELIKLGYVTLELIDRFNYYTGHKKQMPVEDYPCFSARNVAVMAGKERVLLEKDIKSEIEVVNGVVIPIRKISVMSDYADKYAETQKNSRIEKNLNRGIKRSKVYIGSTFGMI